MTNEQIEKEAQDYADRLTELRPTIFPDIAEAFKDGAHFALASQWISVDERLPQGIDPVLVYVSDVCIAPELSHTIAYFEKGAWHFLDSYYYDCKISHWLPIPQLNPENK